MITCVLKKDDSYLFQFSKKRYLSPFLKMRLQKALAQAGIASRRSAVALIESGKVTVNGRIVTQKGISVDLAKDTIAVSGRKIHIQKKIYLLLNKPKNCISTTQDPHLRRCVLDLTGDISERIYPVGRLDKDTTGLLILTNDGDLAHRLMHPKFKVVKVYEAAVKGAVENKAIERLKKGIFIEGSKQKILKAQVLFKSPNKTKLKIYLAEGKKRQIRLMLAYAGHPVTDLKRVKYGNLALGSLRKGQSRFLTAAEVAGLKKIAGI